MSLESAAFDCVAQFSHEVGRSDMTAEEARLADLVGLREALDEVQEMTVDDARAAGLTWQQIGDALGVTRQAVYHRYVDRRRVGDAR